MDTKKLIAVIPRTSGIYQIRCRQNGKIYVGSAVDLRRRWEKHRRALADGAHHNDHLQQAWHLYGEANFEFQILQLVPAAELLRAEQEWIDRTDCTHRKIGFNITRLASTQGEKTSLTWSGFSDPSGKPVTIVNLTEFCRRHELDFSSMHRLAKGLSKLKSYKGWTHVNSIRKRNYIKTYSGFVGPDGKEVPSITNLAEFCRRNGLEKTHMVAVANGRITSHRGWTHVNGKRRQAPREYTGFVAPGGAFTIITNLSAFCRAANLCVVHMHEVRSGKRPGHKGWTWRDHDEAQISEWRRLAAEIHESPYLGNEPVPSSARTQPC
jgi:group I intron endonuclease